MRAHSRHPPGRLYRPISRRYGDRLPGVKERAPGFAGGQPYWSMYSRWAFAGSDSNQA